MNVDAKELRSGIPLSHFEEGSFIGRNVRYLTVGLIKQIQFIFSSAPLELTGFMCDPASLLGIS